MTLDQPARSPVRQDEVEALHPANDDGGDRSRAGAGRLSVATGRLPDGVPLLAFCHLRWDFVTQRPQHLLRRFARHRPVYVWEEPIPCGHHLPYLEHHHFPADGVVALRPRLPDRWSAGEVERGLRALLDQFVATCLRRPPLLWFYTPLMWPLARHLAAEARVYDCMDELANFAFADPRLVELESELMAACDTVFAGGPALYDKRKDRHGDVHAFPSAVDVEHFGAARDDGLPEPADQAGLPHPRLGFFGVIDERIDLALVDALAAARPDWSVVMLGPVVKIDPASLPKRPNLHWLGAKAYGELPAYLAGWDVALMPFALNEATRFISPTKTPEYLAGGRPVVSTPVADVARLWAGTPGVSIAPAGPSFVAACEAALAAPPVWTEALADRLSALSWDGTQARMEARVVAAVARREEGAQPSARNALPKPALTSGRDHDVLVVGAGFAGAVMAERLAREGNQRVLVVDRREHVGGNAYDEPDAAGVLVHRYGPHIFHTNAQSVVDYLSRFTAWRPYQHRVLARVGGQLVPMPINRTTLNMLYRAGLADEASAAAFLAARAEPVADIRTSEDVVVSAVGRELYETFFRGYTRKQWGLDPSALDRSVTARVPTRTCTDDRYFQDTFQAMPAEGYTAMFRRMLDHPNITVATGVDHAALRGRLKVRHTVFTGPIDEFFGCCFGRLPYRSLAFRHKTLDQEWFQPVGVVNEPDERVPYTRVTEYKHLTGQSHPKTSISYEYPSDMGDPYYPVPREANQALFRRYEALARATPDVSFVGRLASYRYYNMDQVVGQALATWRRMAEQPGAHGLDLRMLAASPAA